MEIIYFHPNLKIKTKNIPHLTNSWFAAKYKTYVFVYLLQNDMRFYLFKVW